MKKYLVIGNPIEHSLSPKLHNFWISQNNLDATYNKMLLDERNIKEIIVELKKDKISGINVTVPFKKTVIQFMDQLTPVAKETQSVNTIYKKENKIIGGNTDVGGFECALKHINFDARDKKVFILGAGGVVSSIILTLKKMGAKIVLSNRTKEKAENLKKIFSDLEIVDWGKTIDFDVVINATSLGLKQEDKIGIDFGEYKNKLFYDVIYNREKTNFILEGEKLGNKVENGKTMFLYQAQLAFEIWHGIKPKIDKKVFQLLNND
jgi:shikimate dehydrogenase